jgi:Uma2 family endonuclease
MAGRSKVRFKASDIWDAPEDNLIYEVIDGELFVTPAPGSPHQYCLGELHFIIRGWVGPRNLGFVFLAPIGVELGDDDGVEPDLIFISRERASIIRERGVFGAPDLVVEVLSPSTEARDRGIKARRYAAAGVQHYWLLNPQAKAIEPFVLGETGYEPAGVFGPGSIFRPTLFPGLEIPVDSLWLP